MLVYLRIPTGCFLLALLFSATTSPAQTSNKNPFEGSLAEVESGKKDYANYCQACHGGEGHGGRGHALTAPEFRHGKEDWQLYQTIRQGISGTQMPPFELSPDQIWELVSYLRTLSPSGKEEVVKDDPVAGKEVFFGKGDCQRCHQVNGRGGRIGPDLSTAGLWTSGALVDAILNPLNR